MALRHCAVLPGAKRWPGAQPFGAKDVVRLRWSRHHAARAWRAIQTPRWHMLGEGCPKGAPVLDCRDICSQLQDGAKGNEGFWP